MSRRRSEAEDDSRRSRARLRARRLATVSWLEALAAVLAAGLLVYLVAALLRPEDFL